MKNLFMRRRKSILHARQARHAACSSELRRLLMHIVTTMDFFWIVATILIVVLLHFMMSAAFGFNLLFKICQQVFVWVRGEEYMEEVEDVEPVPRWGHLAITLDSKVFLWGGEGSNLEDRRFLRVFDMHEKKWLKRRTKGTPPQGYVACAYTLIGSVLYIFGGTDDQSYYNDVYQIELNKAPIWKKCKVENPYQEQNQDEEQNPVPMKKRSAGMIARKTEDGRDELVLFGGYGARREDTLPGSTIHRTNEVHRFNIQKGEWSAQDVESRIPIPEWDSFTLTKIDNDHAIVFAGVQQGPGAVNHVYCLQMKDSPTTDDPEWSWVRVATGEKGMPSARRDHATILTGTEEDPQLFMTGGIDRNWRSLGDAWILNLEREAEGRISRGSWFKLVDNATENAEPLEPRYALTANKCEAKRCEQLHLMLFGGTSEDTVIAETTLVDSFDFDQKTMRIYKP